jgi:hypothetical protein
VPDPDNIRNLEWYRERRRQEQLRKAFKSGWTPNRVILLVVGLSLLVGSVATLALIVLLFG